MCIQHSHEIKWWCHNVIWLGGCWNKISLSWLFWIAPSPPKKNNVIIVTHWLIMDTNIDNLSSTMISSVDTHIKERRFHTPGLMISVRETRHIKPILVSRFGMWYTPYIINSYSMGLKGELMDIYTVLHIHTH